MLCNAAAEAGANGGVINTYDFRAHDKNVRGAEAFVFLGSFLTLGVISLFPCDFLDLFCFWGEISLLSDSALETVDTDTPASSAIFFKVMILRKIFSPIVLYCGRYSNSIVEIKIESQTIKSEIFSY